MKPPHGCTFMRGRTDGRASGRSSQAACPAHIGSSPWVTSWAAKPLAGASPRGTGLSKTAQRETASRLGWRCMRETIGRWTGTSCRASKKALFASSRRTTKRVPSRRHGAYRPGTARLIAGVTTFRVASPSMQTRGGRWIGCSHRRNLPVLTSITDLGYTDIGSTDSIADRSTPRSRSLRICDLDNRGDALCENMLRENMLCEHTM